MARRRTPPDAIRIKWQLADRLRTIRIEQFGEHGLSTFAQLLDVPVRTWYSYEAGVTVPAEVVLRFVTLTGVEPSWLLHGRGLKYQTRGEARSSRDLSPVSWSAGDGLLDPSDRLELACIGTSTNGFHSPSSSAGGAPAAGSATAVLLEPELDESSERTDWLPDHDTRAPGRVPSQYVRVEDEAMSPIAAQGAIVGYSDVEEDPSLLDGKLVVAWPGGSPVVRWLHHSGAFAVLRAEQPSHQPSTQLVSLRPGAVGPRIRRVLWVGTAH
jgi:hypothetical protein